ncbi:MAG: alpha/beta hydrolase [Candidatus Saccharibacteria bacterium]|nr:alpha/beta hydrolase [Candidatus Saccharibacteria bacterium]
MKNAIILHGQPGKEEYYDPERPSMSNAHWIAWLQAQLLKNDIAAATPEVPNAFHPDWDLWKQEVERFDINSNTIIVGHSRGGEFWLRYLSDNKDITVGKVVLVAPSLGWHYSDDHYFGDFIIDPGLAKRTNGITIFHSDNDGEGIQKSVKEIRDSIENIKYREFHLGHFTFRSMGTDEFPELLDEVLNS